MAGARATVGGRYTIFPSGRGRGRKEQSPQQQRWWPGSVPLVLPPWHEQHILIFGFSERLRMPGMVLRAATMGRTGSCVHCCRGRYEISLGGLFSPSYLSLRHKMLLVWPILQDIATGLISTTQTKPRHIKLWLERPQVSPRPCWLMLSAQHCMHTLTHAWHGMTLHAWDGAPLTCVNKRTVP